MTNPPATTTLTTTDDGAPGTVLESTDLTLPAPSEVWSHPVDAWTQAEQALNPLRSSEVDRVIAPAAMVIFGVSGDLTSRKLMPALYDLAVGQPLPEGFSIVGVSPTDGVFAVTVIVSATDDNFIAASARVFPASVTLTRRVTV